MDGADVVAYGDVGILPENVEQELRQILSDHPIKRYPEGTYLGVFASSDLESRDIRDPDAVLSDPYPRNIELSEFPPEQNQLYKW
ncbi:hypothetical protein [Haloarcula brevis]|uniref:hypothetical protein n=1 Tax=Haloarcula brevis TaxID=3111453 RepID=UPI00300E79F2